jgi:glycosyltransferase involved in cell wall biosynthesis
MDAKSLLRPLVHRARRGRSRLASAARTERDRLRTRRGAADLAVFFEFRPAPWGGGNQFLTALVAELRSRGLAVELNQISAGTQACLFNSFNFDFRRLRRFARPGCRMVHRVDGPIGVYRGFDDGTDRRIVEINHALADATVLQSRFSLAAHRELGIELRDPVVIPNSVDRSLFFPPKRREQLAGRRLRLIATSWSDNPNKGAPILEWLDGHLDWSRFEMTFAGRTPARLTGISTLPPLPSPELAALLRRQDAYVAPSRNDPCSNALLEALACGLPALYLASGGHPEIVGDGGVPFSRAEELPEILEHLPERLEELRGAISVPSLADVADRYLAVLGIEAPGTGAHPG